MFSSVSQRVTCWRSVILAALAVCCFGWQVQAEDPRPSFYRGINLNGPPVKIDGHDWEGDDADHKPANFATNDKAFANQDVKLNPPTDPDRARMIRSSRWGGNKVTLSGVPAGKYSVFVYVWEDNNSETFRIAINGQDVLRFYQSGTAGHWDRLGPYVIDVKAKENDGSVQITSRGGAANFSGVEIWRGEHDGSPADLTPENVAFFESRIRPLLVKHCYECHSADSKELQGELLVDSRAALRKGGSTGPAIVPGDPEQSLLIKAVRFSDELQMPPEKKLSKDDIADLEKWVSLGAPDPRTKATRYVKKKIDLAAARQFWSFRQIENPAPPAVKNDAWPQGDIDRFILAELERRNLQPIQAADKRTLIRRATYDLTGLPPSPEEIAAFIGDDTPQAWEKVIDRLLASRHYGERWGRHWMDLIRYADTAGDNSDYPVPQLYLYRNYIIDSLNADKPYDQFLREQIAGDLLPAENDSQRNEQIVATGYLASSRRFGSLVDNYPQHLTIEDTIENLGRTVLGLSVSCARCHDHKFDPISNEDYYGLYGIFASTRYPFPGIELDKKPRDFVPLLENGKPGKQVAYAMADSKATDAHVQLRGEPDKPGDQVPRKFLDVLGGQMLSDKEAEQSGRVQLADWITDAQNPLTARVMANRVWHYHFGSGLVKSPSDFGARGQPPTHPQLLDWLATRFRQDGWSLKRLHKLIMLSNTYQLASVARAGEALLTAALSQDPNNDYHWRFSRQRLDAESLRDSLLVISGQLDDTMPREPHPFPPVDKWGFTQHHPFRDRYDSNRRSVYLMTARLNNIPFFATFDGADRNTSTPKRDSSVTTVQSLYLLNNEFLDQQAAKLAGRLLKEATDPQVRLERAVALTLGRPATDIEQAAAKEWFDSLEREFEMAAVPAADRLQQAWTSLTRVLFRSNEFLYVD
ncbi:PSD1 and planctomycete cytochrome C domain-containing protein [Anatilimnocola sp. NA78]|uniref:PSD1 and planctomycete cytochrome C domain-containing protein n=1 Tax=Anatilimnocola sp. NA78 TaxID=3415683 RepID=UPI003CE4F133